MTVLWRFITTSDPFHIHIRLIHDYYKNVDYSCFKLQFFFMSNECFWSQHWTFMLNYYRPSVTASVKQLTVNVACEHVSVTEMCWWR